MIRRKRREIRKVASQYLDKYPGLIQYYENESNLGFDGNVRRLFEKADGEYCLFMGNDDLMCPKALSMSRGRPGTLFPSRRGYAELRVI